MKRTRLIKALLLLAVITAVFAVPSAVSEESGNNISTSIVITDKLGDLTQIECSSPMLYKGQEAVFTVVTGGKDDYTYRFVLSGGENGEDYAGMSEIYWDMPVLLEETNTTGVLRYTPALSSGIYLLDVYISDTAGNEQKVREMYFGGDAADLDDPSTLTGKVASVVAECRAMNFDSDYDIALYLHNWLLDNAEFDRTYTYYTPDGILLRGTGVCESYTYVYYILMNEMGIPCITVSGDAGGGHAWNMIELDGVWGHVDCTWDDDAGADREDGCHSLKYFFICDEQIAPTRTWKRAAYPECGGFWELCGKTGHSFTEQHEAAAPTCTEPGCNAWEVCGICGFSTYEEIPSLGHHPVDGVCTVCGTDHMGEGDLGDLHWKLDLYGTLEITGSGAFEPDITGSMSGGKNYPWLAFADQIKRVLLSEDLTEIGDTAFKGCTGLTSVTIPGGVTRIGKQAFSDCKKLSYVRLPDVLTEIGDYAFSGTDLTSVTIPGGMTRIGKYAFSHCRKLSYVRLPDILTEIGEGAFQSTGLTSVTIPGGVTRIGKSAFSNCEELSYVRLPDILTEIGNFAFSGTGLTSVTIPDSVTEIGEFAFAQTCLTSVTIPDGVTKIKGGTFSDCFYLSYVSLPSGLTELGDDAFFCCDSLSSIVIPDGIARIDENTFYLCFDLSSVTLPRSVSKIGERAFSGCSSLRDVYYQGSIEDREAIDIEDNNDALADAVWHYGTVVYEDMSMLYLPASVTEIASEALAGTGAQVIVIPAACTSVAADAFDGCTDLVYIVNRSRAVITAPQGVTVIDESSPAQESGD